MARSIIIISGDNFHPGVIGIVASRIKDKYNLPVAIIACDQEGIGKASARSIKGVDLGKAILEAKDKGLLINGGGHKMAAGFTIDCNKINEFYQYIDSILKEEVDYAKQNCHIKYDYKLPIEAINRNLYDQLQILEPYGQANRAPRFMLENCKIIKASLMANKYLKLIIADQSNSVYGKSIVAMGWKIDNKQDIEKIINVPHLNISVIGTIKLNKWNDRENIEFDIEDYIF